MKKIIPYFVFIVAFLGHGYAQNFVGIINLETENVEIGEKATVTCFLKSPFCKMVVNSSSKEGSTSYTLYFNDQSSDMVMVSGGTRTIVPMLNIPRNKYLENILVAVPTGKSQTIAGYTANEVNLKSTNAAIQCLVSPDLNIQLPLIFNNTGVIKALKENSIGGTPMEILVKDLSGKQVFSQKITSVSSQPLEDAVFNE